MRSGVRDPSGGLTPSTRVVSIRRGRGWFLFRFRAGSDRVVARRLHEAAYVGGGLGRTILGPEENIKTLKSKDLRSYIDTHYTAPRMVVAAAGALDHEEVVRLAEEHWSGRPTTSSTDFPVDFDRAVFTPTEVRNEDLSEPRAHVALAFDGAEWTSPYSVPLMVLQTLVGQWDRLNPAAGGVDSAPAALARSLASSDSCHSYMTFNTCYKDAGLFGLYLVAPPEGVDQAVATTMSYFATLSTKPERVMSPSDVERAKAQLKANLISQLDALAHVCEELGRQLLTYDRRLPLAELLARIDAVSYEDVASTAARFLRDKGHAQAAHGSLGNLRPFEACHVSNFN